MSYENFKSDGQESDEVAQLLGTLKRVEAPGDFDMRLKARIANASAAAAPRRFPFLRLAVPVGVLGALAAVFFFAGIFTQPIDQVQVVSDKPQQVTNAEVAPVIASDTNTQDPQTGSDQKPNDAELAGAKSGNSAPPMSESNRVERRPGGSIDMRSTSGGSKDSTANIPEKPKLPRGFDPEANVTNVPPRGIDKNTKVSVADILKMIGVDAELRSGAWIANSVKANSPAQRAGIKPKDEIEALGDIPIARTTTLNGTVNFRNIRIKRDGRILRLGF